MPNEQIIDTVFRAKPEETKLLNVFILEMLMTTVLVLQTQGSLT